MQINKYCFSSKNGYQTSICEATSWPFHVRLQEFLIGGGGGGGSIPDFLQVLNVFYSGSSMVYFGSNFFLGGGGGEWGRVV